MFAITIDEPEFTFAFITEQAIANHKPDPDAFLKQVRPAFPSTDVFDMLTVAVGEQ